jgi:hypothetical protein
MSYKPRHVAKLKTSSGKKKLKKRTYRCCTHRIRRWMRRPRSSTRAAPRNFMHNSDRIPEMHNSDRIRNPKPSENHLTTVSVRTNPTSWTCSQPETLNPESSTSQQQLTNAICSQPPTHICSRRNAQENEVAEARGAGGERGPRGNTVFTGGTTFRKDTPSANTRPGKHFPKF